MARVAFVQNVWYEQVGTLILSAVLKRAGHAVEVFIDLGEKDPAASIAAFRPDIVAYSITTGNQHWAISMTRRFRPRLPPGTLFIMGGPHPTFFPRVVEEGGFDAICRGEGEGAIADLAAAVDAGRPIDGIANLCVLRNGSLVENAVRPLIGDLDTVPYADRDLYEKYAFFRKDGTHHFSSSRGCPYRCTYCYNEQLAGLYKGKGRYLRRRSIENVLGEVDFVRWNHRLKTAVFVDDTFCFDERWVLPFLARYASEIAIPLVVDSRPEIVTGELARALARAGCTTLRFGLESGNQRIRREIMGRNISDEDIVRASRLLHNEGIRILTYNILGTPGETLENAFETMDLNRRIHADYPRFSLFCPYPGTRLGDRSVEMGLVDSKDALEMGSSYLRESLLRTPEMREIQNLLKLYWLAVRAPRLRGVLRRLLKLPPNPLFEIFYLITLGIQYARSMNRGIFTTLQMGLRNLPFFFLKARLDVDGS